MARFLGTGWTETGREQVTDMPWCASGRGYVSHQAYYVLWLIPTGQTKDENICLAPTP